METALIAPDYPITNSLNNISNDVQRVAALLNQRDYSTNSWKALASDIKHFLQWYISQTGEALDFNRVTLRECATYRDDMQRDGLSPSTVNRRLISLRIFFRAASELGILNNSNPVDGVKRAAVQSLAPKGLMPQETRRFLKEIELRAILRDLLIVHLQLLAGLRASEVIGLMVQDVVVTERKGHIVVRRAKGNKQREVPLNRLLRELVSQYIDHEKREGKLFIGQRGPLTTQAINKIVGKYALKAGMHVHPHTLRHTFAYAYLQQNKGDIVGLAQILGHSNISTTQIYTQHRLQDLEERVELVNF